MTKAAKSYTELQIEARKNLGSNLGKKGREIFYQFTMGSSCSVQVTNYWSHFWGPLKGELCSVVIEFFGRAARLPAKSNGLRVYESNEKRFSNVTKSRIGPSIEVRAGMQALASLYLDACMSIGTMIPTFHEEEVFVHCFTSRKMNNQDRHNVPKFVGDWLEMVQLVDNDSRAQIISERKSDYPELFDGSLDSTRIEVQRRLNVFGLHKRHIHETREQVKGFDRLIG